MYNVYTTYKPVTDYQDQKTGVFIFKMVFK